MRLSDDHRAVQDAVRSYVQRLIAPQAARWDRESHFPREELRASPRSAATAWPCPEWDGAGLDYLALAVILEEIAAGDGATSTIVSVNNCPVCSILMAWGRRRRRSAGCAAGPRRDARRLLPHRAAGRLAGRRAEDDRAVRDGDAYSSTASSSSSPAEERRRRDRHGRDRSGGRQARHQRVPRADRDAGLPRRPHRGQARPARQRHGADRLRGLPRSRSTTCSARKGRA